MSELFSSVQVLGAQRAEVVNDVFPKTAVVSTPNIAPCLRVLGGNFDWVGDVAGSPFFARFFQSQPQGEKCVINRRSFMGSASPNFE